jgi:hypothetical protein
MLPLWLSGLDRSCHVFIFPERRADVAGLGNSANKHLTRISSFSADLDRQVLPKAVAERGHSLAPEITVEAAF